MFLGGINTKFSKTSAKEFASFFHTLINLTLRHLFTSLLHITQIKATSKALIGSIHNPQATTLSVPYGHILEVYVS